MWKWEKGKNCEIEKCKNQQRKNVKMRKCENEKMRKRKKRWSKKKREKLKNEKNEKVWKNLPLLSLSLAKFKIRKIFSCLAHPPSQPTHHVSLSFSLSVVKFLSKKKNFLAARPQKNEEEKKKRPESCQPLFFRRPHSKPQKKNCHPWLFKFLLNFHCLSWGFPTLVSCFSSCRFSALPLPQFMVLLPLLSSPPPTLLVSHPFVCLSPVSLLPLSLLPCHLVWVCLCLCFGRCLCLAHPPTHHVSLSLSVANFFQKKTERENEKNQETKKCEKDKKEKKK